MRYSGVRALVVGMERSGVAAAALLARLGARVEATDVKPLAELPRAAGELERNRVAFRQQSPEVFESAELIVLSPGVPPDLPPIENARRRGATLIGEVELAAPFLKGRTIGITGSNGKTTVTALTGHLLRECGVAAQVGGNIGTAVCAMVESSREDQWNVLELSSFQLESIREFHAGVAACLNVTPDHLDRHGTFQRYAAAKRRLFETQRAGDFAVLNAEDEVCESFAAATEGSPVWFSSARVVAPGLWLEDGAIRFNGATVMDAGAVPIRGRHNLENAMAAIACARLAGAELDAIAAAVTTFKAVEHRLEFVRTLGGVAYYNDSKATNVDATLKALDAFKGGLWVILGGKDKGSDYTALREPLRTKARAALLIGAAAPRIREQVGEGVEWIEAGTLERAVAEASRRASCGETVLLAPACASFDQFRNYEHRGQVFKELVAAIGGKE